MTEREYVEAIRAVAGRYIEVIRNPLAFEDDTEGWLRIKRWESIKEKLSAHTAIDICTAWLDAQDAPQASEASGVIGGTSSDGKFEADVEIPAEILEAALCQACAEPVEVSSSAAPLQSDAELAAERQSFQAMKALVGVYRQGLQTAGMEEAIKKFEDAPRSATLVSDFFGLWDEVKQAHARLSEMTEENARLSEQCGRYQTALVHIDMTWPESEASKIANAALWVRSIEGEHSDDDVALRAQRSSQSQENQSAEHIQGSV